ncbi:YbjN domain-containing protein [Microcoleus sp. FACHB-SPT15]|uniref:YbjN domain-containing protein n=1 Tax=Microcoleus sp. FACHB-SPT15 TaxID=2692830 RepID=UPI0017846526|nr:YbjN domain-containing protein [Microcoleus sp. FACHB-SPT15]MBD1808384.1 YbjN domain-containing protein [Microcoleus sp. FACHB-SPT15]
MNVKTENHPLNSELTLRDSSQSPLPIHAVTLALTKQDDELIECRLTFQVNPELYQRINTEALFNLKPEVRNPLSAGEFLPEPDIKIKTTLKPDLLPRLAGYTANIDEAATYILNLSQEQPDDPLLSTENWLALSVKQLQESGETGYRTLWDYISPAALAQAATSGSSEEINYAIVNFFKDWTEANLSEVTQKATSQMLEGMTNFFNELADVNLDEKVETFRQNLSTSGQIFEEMVNFFKEDEWPFYEVEGKSILQMAFQGENGKWTCYAKARVEQEQFVFYSICPVNAPENKRLAVAEFLTRANSGMIIGNFELDFADGEVRYKTSIDVDGDTLSSALIKRLVYANVTMMDEYLPGIMSVIYGDVEPKDAITQIESQPE